MLNQSLSLLLICCVFAACRSEGNESLYQDDDNDINVVGSCQGEASGEAYELETGSFTGTISASDTTDCGIDSSGTSDEHVLEVSVTDSTITLEPGTPTQVSIIRGGNKLCGTSQREFRLTADSNLCILDEADEINGEVTADGKFWVDLDFSWKRKGGVCSSLTLPCSGRTTWTFVK